MPVARRPRDPRAVRGRRRCTGGSADDDDSTRRATPYPCRRPRPPSTSRRQARADRLRRRLVAGVALAFSAYQLVIAAFRPLSSLPTRSLHVGFLLLLVVPDPPGRRAREPAPHRRGTTRCSPRVAFALAFYHWVFEADLIQRSGDPTHGRPRRRHRCSSCWCSRRRGACSGWRCRSSARPVPRLRPVRPIPARPPSRTAATASTRSSTSSSSAPRASSASRRWCRRRTSSCSSCSAASSSTPG